MYVVFMYVQVQMYLMKVKLHTEGTGTCMGGGEESEVASEL